MYYFKILCTSYTLPSIHTCWRCYVGYGENSSWSLSRSINPVPELTWFSFTGFRVMVYNTNIWPLSLSYWVFFSYSDDYQCSCYGWSSMDFLVVLYSLNSFTILHFVLTFQVVVDSHGVTMQSINMEKSFFFFLHLSTVFYLKDSCISSSVILTHFVLLMQLGVTFGALGLSLLYS